MPIEISFGDALVSSLALSPDFASDPLCFAGTGASLFVSADGGQSWQDALASLQLETPVAITAVICAAPPSLQDLLVVAGVSGGVLRSEDRGQTWQFTPIGTPPAEITALAAAPDGLLYAGAAEDGVFISKDNGLSWARWNFGLLDWHIFSLAVVSAPDQTQTVFAGTETGVFYSSNHGRTWRETNFPINAGAVLALGAPGENQSGPIFAGTEAGKLFRSSDQGRSWEPVNEALFDAEIGAVIARETVLVASGNRLFVSVDGGSRWTEWGLQEPVPGTIMALAAPGTLEPGLPLFIASSERVWVY
jgi:photosystem II stability/assembly factor-like uncharacterized protein